RDVIVWRPRTSPGARPDGFLDYEALIAPEPESFTFPAVDERRAAGLCYTSGSTGRPKGVLYSHRAIVLHSLAQATPDMLSISHQDVVLPAGPLFPLHPCGPPFPSPMCG